MDLEELRRRRLEAMAKVNNDSTSSTPSDCAGDPTPPCQEDVSHSPAQGLAVPEMSVIPAMSAGLSQPSQPQVNLVCMKAEGKYSFAPFSY